MAEEGAATLPPGLAKGGSGSGAVRVGGAPLNIADGVRKISRASRNRIAVVGGDRSLTYGALKEHSSRLGCALLARGLSPGQPVAVLLGNRLEKDGRRLGKGGVHAPRETPTPSMRVVNSSVARAERTDDLADPACCQILGDPALMSED